VVALLSWLSSKGSTNDDAIEHIQPWQLQLLSANLYRLHASHAVGQSVSMHCKQLVSPLVVACLIRHQVIRYSLCFVIYKAQTVSASLIILRVSCDKCDMRQMH